MEKYLYEADSDGIKLRFISLMMICLMMFIIIDKVIINIKIMVSIEI